MIKRNGSNGDVARTAASILDESISEGINAQILRFIRALYVANFKPISLDDALEDEAGGVVLALLDWLRQEEFLSGSNEEALLTTKGLKSLKSAQARDHRVAQYLNETPSVSLRLDPNQILISILRAHFLEWQDKKELR